MLESLYDYLQTDWSRGTSLMRDMAVPFFVALFGAFAGGLAAALSERRANHISRQLLHFNQMRSANALAVAVCTGAIEFKSQNIKPVIDTYHAQRERFWAHWGMPTVKSAPFTVDFDLKVIPIKELVVEELLDAFKSIPMRSPQMIFHAVKCSQVLAELNSHIGSRNILVGKFELAEFGDTKKAAHHYFGISQTNGVEDTRFKDCSEAIEFFIDNLIYHSLVLYKISLCELFELRRDMPRRLRSRLLIANVNLSPYKELIPTAPEYNYNFESMHVKKRPWYKGSKNYEAGILMETFSFLSCVEKE